MSLRIYTKEGYFNKSESMEHNREYGQIDYNRVNNVGTTKDIIN